MFKSMGVRLMCNQLGGVLFAKHIGPQHIEHIYLHYVSIPVIGNCSNLYKLIF